MKLELQKQELDLRNIKIYEYDFKTCNAVTLFIDGNYCIGIKKNITSREKFWLLEHELEHIKSGLTYHINDDKFIINQAERKVNERMILKNQIVSLIYNAVESGMKKDEICEVYSIPSDVYDLAIEHIKKRLIMTAYNYYLDR